MKPVAPITVAEASRRVQSERFLLPGIQRSFVWETEQISTLFDSLMRGYPIGNLIVWRTRRGDHPKLPFRRLVTNYEGKSTTPVRVFPPVRQWIDAVLDGQQRLTALAIGVMGSHAASERGKPRYLFLNLDGVDNDAGPDSRAYPFAFLTESAAQNADGDEPWFWVGDAFELRRDGLRGALERAEIEPNRRRLSVLRRLVEVINHERVLSESVEATTDLDRVLNIFSRINKGGTALTYVDLLVGTATARWKNLDAAREITKLRNDLNAYGMARNNEGFRIDTDRLVKAGLVLLGAKEPKFHVESFLDKDLGQRLETSWPEFSRAMRTAVATLAEFGLSQRTLVGQNALIPVAFYAWHRKLPESYATAHKHERDRQRVRAFVARTLLQRAFWTGAVDPVLVAARDMIQKHGRDGFPLDEIARAMPATKRIDVSEALILELCELPYSDRRTLTLLRMLFPDQRASQRLDKDHIFPRAKLNPNQVQLAGLPAADLGRLANLSERLPNLQLLDTADNVHKKTSMPKEWFTDLSPTAKRFYTAQGVKHLPPDLSGFEVFYDKRRGFLETRIRRLLQGKRAL